MIADVPNSLLHRRLATHLVSAPRALTLWVSILLIGLLPRAGQSQTNTTSPQPPDAPVHRRAPAVRVTHGSISGSQANPLADHPIAQLLDRISESNRLGVELFGYLDQGVTLNTASPRDRLNGPLETNYRSNDYQLNGLYLIAERKVDPSAYLSQWGFRADLLYGTDPQLGGSSLGFDDRITTSRFYSLAFPQLYANLFHPLGDHGISFKIGKFYTPIGNEWLINTENFFYSHFLSWNIQPGTHTGILAASKLSDTITVQFGPNFGWNTSENSNQAVSYLTTVGWKSLDERAWLDFAIQTGRQQGVISAADANVTMYSLIFNKRIGESWHYQAEHDLLVGNSRIGLAADDFESYSLANYLFYNVNNRWRAGLRFEWLRDDDGTLAGFDPKKPAAPGVFYNLTLGVNWHPRDHLRIRPEIRRDWQVRDARDIPPAFDDSTSTNQWLFACDVLWEF